VQRQLRVAHQWYTTELELAGRRELGGVGHGAGHVGLGSEPGKAHTVEVVGGVSWVCPAAKCRPASASATATAADATTVAVNDTTRGIARAAARARGGVCQIGVTRGRRGHRIYLRLRGGVSPNEEIRGIVDAADVAGNFEVLRRVHIRVDANIFVDAAAVAGQFENNSISGQTRRHK